jgi:hypothetical protein
MSGKIIIEIDEFGEVKFDVKGVKGKTCKELTKPLEKELGVEKEKKLKPEYFLKSDTKVSTKKKLKL